MADYYLTAKETLDPFARKPTHVIIVPDWIDEDIYNAVMGVVQNEEVYRSMGCLDFRFPRFQTWRVNNDTSVEMMHKKFDKGIARTVERRARKMGADVVLLEEVGGSGHLDIYGYFYRKKKFYPAD